MYNNVKPMSRKLMVITDSTNSTRVFPVVACGFYQLTIAIERDIAKCEWEKVARYAERVAVNYCRNSNGAFEVPEEGFDVCRSVYFK